MNRLCVGLGVAAVIAIAITAAGGASAQAAGPPGGNDYLASAADYAVLGAATVTNTGPSIIDGDVGVYPGTEVTGFGEPGGGTVNGVIHAGDGDALNARNDLMAAYTIAANLPSDGDVGTADLTGRSFTAGVYSSASSLLISGTVTLIGDADDVFVFQVGSTLTMGTGSTIALSGEAQACNVFWQIGSSATLNAETNFVGTILASESISVLNAATVQGRLLGGAGAPTGAVTLINDTVTVPVCEPADADTDADGAADAGVDGAADVDADVDGAADVDADGGSDIDADGAADVDADGGSDTDADGGSDTDVDGAADVDVDGAADVDAGVDVDAGADTDVDAAADVDAGVDVDGAADTDTDTVTDTDAAAGLDGAADGSTEPGRLAATGMDAANPLFAVVVGLGFGIAFLVRARRNRKAVLTSHSEVGTE